MSTDTNAPVTPAHDISATDTDTQEAEGEGGEDLADGVRLEVSDVPVSVSLLGRIHQPLVDRCQISIAEKVAA